MDEILTDRSSIEGERRLVTVLFADVAKYTAIAEQLDAEEVHQIMDDCFKILMDEIHKYEGTINRLTEMGLWPSSAHRLPVKITPRERARPPYPFKRFWKVTLGV